MRPMPLRPMLLAVCALLMETTVAGSVSDTQVTFQTTACDGSTGFASVELERIWRINPAGCTAPDNPDQPLLQVLVKSLTGLTNYEVFIVSPQEAASIQEQIKQHMAAKRKALEGSGTIVIEH